MHTKEFDYYRADSVDDAIEQLEAHDGAELMAGAHGLLPRMKTGEESPPALVDISHLDGLATIDRDGDTLSIGALATHADIAESQQLKQHSSALSDAAGEVGDLQVRNGGTIGGNIAHGDPRSDPLAAVLALDVELSVQGPDSQRTIDADDVFHGAYETAVRDHEFVTGLGVPVQDDAVSAYAKRRNPLSGYAMVGVAARLRLDSDTVTDARIGVTGVADTPFRLPAVEDALEGESVDGDIVEEAAGRVEKAVDPSELRGDSQSSGEYRAHLLSVYTEKAVTAALNRAG
ncbi:FAD binding domain-containing protein [Halorientalis pallida]|uniref:Xanthine dehydrogenase family protein subunit M n=1 Tax=Halorientalis pallida TaxID=2479928 RepID=A0A498KSZ2_9EURY|nr:xanthine dehydrogenase family protein subunit M [Halorientalis pallida]RXK47897.1 xanthine dehydrogenase family protein subunit M [Halorientalis pallida]